MKQPDKQIIQMLQAFNQDAVLKAFDLYKQGINDAFKETVKQLKEDGWEPFETQPENKEFYFFNEKYWVQNEEAREKFKQRFLKEQSEVKKQSKSNQAGQAEQNRSNKAYTGQKMDLALSELKCPKCRGGLYKQAICTGCKEGKQGFKIRLICEDNPDHEILL